MKMNDEEKFEFRDGSGDKEYFTIVPNYVLNHSTATDQALYLQLKRLAGDGKRDYCYPSFRYLKKQLGVGEAAIKKSFKYLTEHCWIENLGKRRVMTAGGMQWVSAYKVNDIWKQNVEFYKGVPETDPLSKVSLKKPKVSPETGKVSPVIGAKEERKKNIIKDNHSSFKKSKPYFRGNPMWKRDDGKWFVIEAGEFKEFAGGEFWKEVAER